MSVNDLWNDFKRLDVWKRALILGVPALLALGVLAVAAWPSGGSGQKELLWGDLTTKQAGQIATKLDQMGVNYAVSGDGTAIMVPQARAAELRIQLARQDLPKSKAKGYQILDKTDPMGMTDKMQRVRIVQAKEGELAQSVRALDSVTSARVHIVMPERQPFSREAPTPEASVVVETNSAAGLDEERAAGIQSLVASAVPKLTQDKVTVLDSSGAVLTANQDGGVTGGGDLQDIRREREAQIRKAIRDVLAPYVGRGNIRASVTAEVDRSAETITERDYDPEQRVLRSVQTSQSSEQSEEQEPENVSAGENQPGNQGGGNNQATSTSQSEETNETRNYEIGSTKRTERKPAGTLESVNVAVVVDGSYEQSGNGAEYVPRSDQEMQRIRDLVRSAVGVEQDRGDQLSVENVRFKRMQAGTTADQATQETPSGGGIGLGLWEIVAIGLTLVVLTALALFGWRVLQRSEAEAEATPEQIESGGQVPAGEVEGPSASGSESTVQIGDDKHDVSGNVMEKITTKIDEDPDKAAFAVQQMLASGTKK